MIVRGRERTAGEMTGMTGEEEGINLRKRTVNSILNYNINLLKPCNTILYSFYCKQNSELTHSNFSNQLITKCYSLHCDLLHALASGIYNSGGVSQKARMFAHFYIYFLLLSFTGGPRLESGTGAVSGAAEESTGTTRGADERDFPLHVMT